MKKRIAFIAQGLEVDIQEAENRTAWAIYDDQTSKQIANGESPDFDTAVDTAVAELDKRLGNANDSR